jgi:hypothetical protein
MIDLMATMSADKALAKISGWNLAIPSLAVTPDA